MRSSARSGSHFAMNTLRNGTTPARVTPFNNPEIWAPGVEIVDDEPWRDRVARALDFLRAEEVVQWCRDRADPPARAVEDRDFVAVGRLPRDRGARFYAPRPQSARDARHAVGEPGRRHAREQLVERRT